MLFNSPLHVTKAERIIDQLRPKPGARILDLGCGEGEFLIRVAERYEIEGLGIDISADLIGVAQAKAEQRVPSGNLKFSTQDALIVLDQATSWDLIICIGAEYIFGGYEQALRKLKPLLNSGGSLLIGTIYWKQPPPPDYLALMGGENPHFNHATTVQLAVDHGFIPLYVCRSNDDEWDDFESSVSQRRYLDLLNKPPSEQATKQLEQTWEWQRGYLKWGSSTMGFGFYLLRATQEG